MARLPNHALFLLKENVSCPLLEQNAPGALRCFWKALAQSLWWWWYGDSTGPGSKAKEWRWIRKTTAMLNPSKADRFFFLIFNYLFLILWEGEGDGAPDTFIQLTKELMLTFAF